uniref:Uncharacterized protein n=1 Tax=Panagrolaimus davidi TaxID=227884 RepID=A0A914RE77_9BILA
MEYIQRAFSILIRRNIRKIKEENVWQLNSRSEFISSCFSQSFSLPDSIIFYVLKNPTTTKLYQNLIQTCKYFFVKNPIIVSPNYSYSRDLGKWCIKKTPFDFSQLICKFWITENYNISSILPKLYKCDAKKVTFQNEVISFYDLPLFTKTAEDITFNEITVKDSDGSIVPFEKIFEAFIYARKFKFSSDSTLPNITSKTFNELLKIPHFSKLELMNLNGIPDIFDIEAFYIYVKENKTTKFYLIFDNSISARYKNRLGEIIDEILSTNVLNYESPFIYFDGLEYDKILGLKLQYFHL